jgi:uncharacterized protein YkwD
MTSLSPAIRIARRLTVVGAIVGLLAGCLLLSDVQVQAKTLMNNDRTRNSLRALPSQADAQAKAQSWADKLARENALYHSDIRAGINTKWCSLGENVGYGGSLENIETAYMNSPHHRANILNSTFNGVGVGVARNGDRVFSVQEFITTC